MLARTDHRHGFARFLGIPAFDDAVAGDDPLQRGAERFGRSRLLPCRSIDSEEKSIVGLCGKRRRCLAEGLLVGDRIPGRGIGGERRTLNALRPLAQALQQVWRAAGIGQEETGGRARRVQCIRDPDRLLWVHGGNDYFGLFLPDPCSNLRKVVGRIDGYRSGDPDPVHRGRCRGKPCKRLSVGCVRGDERDALDPGLPEDPEDCLQLPAVGGTGPPEAVVLSIFGRDDPRRDARGDEEFAPFRDERSNLHEFRACRRADDDIDIVAPGQFFRICESVAGARVPVYKLDRAAADTALPVHRIHRPGESVRRVHGKRPAPGQQDTDTDGDGIGRGGASCRRDPCGDDTDEREDPE
ncbi:hypothetical protein ES707_08493 [subsurface metagenome]